MMRRRKTLVLGFMMFMLTLCMGVNSVVASATEADNSTLAQCVQTNGKLIVVVLMDQSGSVNSHDPDARRVDGLRSMLIALNEATPSTGDAASTQPSVEVLLAGFWGGVDPNPEGESLPWLTLDDANMSGVLAQADKFAALDNFPETDYATAFAAAQRMLSRRVADSVTPPCTAIVFFTDGRFEIRDRVGGNVRGGLPTTVKWSQDVDLSKDGGGKEAVVVGKRYLCSKNGLIDQLRGGDTSIYSVALTQGMRSDDRAFLEGLTTGGGACGRRTSKSVGQFLAADDADSLFFGFRNLVTGENPEIKQGAQTFTLESGLDGFLIRAVTGDPATALRLTSPRGKVVDLKPDVDGKQIVDGVEIDTTWGSNTTVEVRGTVREGQDWVGPWQYEFVGGADADDSHSTFQYFADISTALDGDPTALRGEPTALSFVLKDSKGALIKSSSILERTSIDAVITDPATGDRYPVPISRSTTAGVFTGVLNLPEDVSSPSVFLDVTTIYSLKAGGLTSPERRSFKLATKLPENLGYPFLEPTKLNLAPIEDDKSSRGTLTINGSSRSKGCFWLNSFVPRSGNLVNKTNVDVKVGGKKAPTTRESCRKIQSGEKLSVEVTVRSIEKLDALFLAPIKFGVESDIKPEPRLISAQISVQLTRSPQIGQRLWLTALLTSIGLLIPVGLLVLLNYDGAKFSPPSMIRHWSGDVVVDQSANRMTLPSGASINPSLLDLPYLDQFESEATRTANVDPFNLKAVAVGSLGGSGLNWLVTVIRGPYGMANAGATAVLGGGEQPLVSWPDHSAHEVPLALAGSWLFTPTKVNRPNAESSTAAKPTITGKLTVFVAGEDAGDQLLTTLGRASAQLLATDLLELAQARFERTDDKSDGFVTGFRDRFRSRDEEIGGKSVWDEIDS